ncbi:MAG: helix-turn-helix transcriptional regulator [Tatlockia sp.]|nr:helix-turn-helix transcriptional regulator [Tatlockia sp.]
MSIANQGFDTSLELAIFKNKTGFKLVNPDKKSKLYPFCYDTGFTIADLMQLPFNVGFSTPEIIIQCINSETAKTLDFNSTDSARGKKISHVVQPKSAELVLQNNLSALKNNKVQMIEEEIIRKDNLPLQRLSFYSPLYGNEEKIIGVFGCTVVMGHQALDSSLTQISRLGFLDSFKKTSEKILPDFFLCGVYFTNREKEILWHIIRGKSAQAIANLFKRSKRTIEQHIEHMKIKTNSLTKSELIEKIVDHFFI